MLRLGLGSGLARLREHHRERHQGEDLPREAGEGLAALQAFIPGVDALRLLLLLLIVVVC